MKIKHINIALLALLVSITSKAQDTSKILKEVIVTRYKTVNGVGRLLDVIDGIIYAGKKTEVMIVDSLDANKAIKNIRQIQT